MPIYTNKLMAKKYWEESLRFEEFHNTKRENNIMKEKIQDAIKNSVLVESPKNLICWCNQYRLVPKANGDMRLVDIKKINQFMVQKHFKMEGTPTLQDLIRKNDFAITFDLKEAYKHVPVHPIFQNTIHGNYIYISGMP
jgi:hypothetical protein